MAVIKGEETPEEAGTRLQAGLASWYDTAAISANLDWLCAGVHILLRGAR